MKRIMSFLFFIFSLSLFADTAKVLHVSDGDTFIASTKKGKTKVRLYGVDAPEKSQEYGLKSLSYLQFLISNKNVKLKVMGIDQYGRTIAKVFYNGTDINTEMISSGNAWWYEQFARNEKIYEKAQKSAKEQKIGLWSKGNPIPPWEYRKNHSEKY